MAEASLPPLVLLLLLALNVAFASAGSVNLACGRRDSFTDSNGTSWKGDGNYILLGVPAEVNYTAGVPEPLTHLRWFISRTCYHFDRITVGSSVTVTTEFYYGNYDGKDSPPKFQVQCDNNPEKTIVTGSKTVTYSLTYKALSDTVNLCFDVPIDDFTNTAFVNTIQVELEGSGVNTVLQDSGVNTVLQDSGVNTVFQDDDVYTVLQGARVKPVRRRPRTRTAFRSSRRIGNTSLKAFIVIMVVVGIILVLLGVTICYLVLRQRKMARLAIQQGANQGDGENVAMVQSAASPHEQGSDGVQQNPQGVKPDPAVP